MFSTRCTRMTAIRSQLSSKKSTLNVHKAQKYSLKNTVSNLDKYSSQLNKYNTQFGLIHFAISSL